MFCKNCGKEISDNSAFCTECGAKSEKESNLNEIKSVESTSGTSSATAINNENKSNSHGSIIIAKIGIFIALICFFFTFMSVSCAGETRELSGKDLIFGDKSVTSELDDEYDSHSNLFNIFVCLSAVSGILALVIKKAKTAGGLSLLSSIFLLIFRLSAKHYYKLGGESLKSLEDYIEVHFGFALYLAMILFFIAAAIIGSALPDSENKSSSTGENNAVKSPPKV